MSRYGVLQDRQESLAIERWLDEGGRVAPDALIERDMVRRERHPTYRTTRRKASDPGVARDTRPAMGQDR
jgi:hypothetical protein